MAVATNVDPETGRRDLDIPGSLREAFGHKELGIYSIAREGGRVGVGDAVLTPADAATRSVARAPVTPRPPERQTFMCGGCYYIYEPSAGIRDQLIGPGTPFAAIPAHWRCPDCGTDKSTFRPYVEAAPSRTAV